jgi:large subunit ribosomal protein L19
MKAQKLTKETIGQLAVSEREFPPFNIGDTVAISQRIKEGDKERTQIFEGDVIAMKGTGASRTFTVRKIAADKVPVERIFPYFATFIEDIKLIKTGKVRRAKLYYIRDRVGKAARIKEVLKKKTNTIASKAKKISKAASKASESTSTDSSQSE